MNPELLAVMAAIVYRNDSNYKGTVAHAAELMKEAEAYVASQKPSSTTEPLPPVDL